MNGKPTLSWQQSLSARVIPRGPGWSVTTSGARVYDVIYSIVIAKL